MQDGVNIDTWCAVQAALFSLYSVVLPLENHPHEVALFYLDAYNTHPVDMSYYGTSSSGE